MFPKSASMQTATKTKRSSRQSKSRRLVKYKSISRKHKSGERAQVHVPHKLSFLTLVIDTENKVRLQQLHKTKTSTSEAKVASRGPKVMPYLTCKDDRFAVLEIPYNNKEEMCMGVNLPADFPPHVLAIVWIQRVETFGPLCAYKWACTRKAELQGLYRNAVRSILLSSHGPENKLLQIMLEEMGDSDRAPAA